MTRIDKNEWTPRGVPDLEANAWQALDTGHSNILVTSGAGAGKTEFLAQKAAFLLQTQTCPSPKRILAISFKREAAYALKERVGQRAGEDLMRRFDSLTFDAFTKSLLDRFRPTLPLPYSKPRTYTIISPQRKDYEAFLSKYNFDLKATNFTKFLKNSDLPIFECSSKKEERAVAQFWSDTFLNTENPSLSFDMMNRLVKYILTENSCILRALRATYPFVFLDEFQDTTVAQYDLLHAIFAQSNSVLTAVGDNKQSIMKWAGAMDKVFDRFVEDFSAKTITLQNNWRSHEALVKIQNRIASELEKKPQPVKATGTCEINDTVASIWRFESKENEIKTLAEWIQTEIATSQVQPQNIAILCKQNVGSIANDLLPVFTTHNITIRNLASMIDTISIEDLLTEPITRLFIAILRLVTTERSPNYWEEIVETFQYIHGINPDDEISQQRIQKTITKILQKLKYIINNTAPSYESAEFIAITLLELIEKKNLQKAFLAYRKDTDFDRVWNGFLKLFQKSAVQQSTWSNVLDAFEGIGQIALMTIHKSKGLEFHTVIVYGFDNRYWKYLSKDNIEEKKILFVALTRAKQRIVITQCGKRSNTITELSQTLNSVGVEILNFMTSNTINRA